MSASTATAESARFARFDVVDLVFPESHVAGLVAKHDRYDIAKFRDTPAKMAKKMSACGRAAALSGSPMPSSRGASACRDDACMDAASDP